MGAPLSGGGSTWFHHADTFDLLDRGATLWARVLVPVERDRVTITFPLLDDPSSTFHAFEVLLEDGRVVARQWTAGEQRDVAWTATTPAAELISSPRIHRRRRFEPHGTELQAILEASLGAITVRDAAGVARIYLRLGADDPAWSGGERGVLGGGAQPAVALWFPPVSIVRKVATSMP